MRPFHFAWKDEEMPRNAQPTTWNDFNPTGNSACSEACDAYYKYHELEAGPTACNQDIARCSPSTSVTAIDPTTKTITVSLPALDYKFGTDVKDTDGNAVAYNRGCISTSEETKCSICKGGCLVDDDCAGHLKCKHFQKGDIVPGCDNSDAKERAHTDYWCVADGHFPGIDDSLVVDDAIWIGYCPVDNTRAGADAEFASACTSSSGTATAEKFIRGTNATFAVDNGTTTITVEALEMFEAGATDATTGPFDATTAAMDTARLYSPGKASAYVYEAKYAACFDADNVKTATGPTTPISTTDKKLPDTVKFTGAAGEYEGIWDVHYRVPQPGMGEGIANKVDRIISTAGKHEETFTAGEKPFAGELTGNLENVEILSLCVRSDIDQEGAHDMCYCDSGDVAQAHHFFCGCDPTHYDGSDKPDFIKEATDRTLETGLGGGLAPVGVAAAELVAVYT